MFYIIYLHLRDLFLPETKMSDCRGFQHGLRETSILSLGLVRSMAGMMSKLLPLKWKVKQMKKFRDMQKFLKKDTKNLMVSGMLYVLHLIFVSFVNYKCIYFS